MKLSKKSLNLQKILKAMNCFIIRFLKIQLIDIKLIFKRLKVDLHSKIINIINNGWISKNFD